MGAGRPGLILLLALASGCGAGFRGAAATPRMDSDPQWRLVPEVPLVRQRAQADCGLAALRMMLARWRCDASEQALTRELPGSADRQGIEAGTLRSAARRRGLDAFLIEGNWDDL